MDKDIGKKVQQLVEYIDEINVPVRERSRSRLEDDYEVLLDGVKLLSTYSALVGSEYQKLQADYDELLEYVEQVKDAVEGDNLEEDKKDA